MWSTYWKLLFFSWVSYSIVSFIGETDKWTAVSEQRFYNIELTANDISIYMKGVPAENVNLKFAVKNNQDEIRAHSIVCEMPPSGKSVLIITAVNSDILASCNKAWVFKINFIKFEFAKTLEA